MRDVLVHFCMTHYKIATTPFLLGVQMENGKDTLLIYYTMYSQLVGSLLYLTHFYSNISYVVDTLSRYRRESYELHWNVVNQILKFVLETINYGIHYVARCTLDPLSHTISYWFGNNIHHKSILRYVLNFGSSPICWSNKKLFVIYLP